MEDMFNTKMKKFWKSADKQHKQLEADFVNSQKKLMDLGIYLGQKNDTEFEYLSHLFQFATSVSKTLDDIAKVEKDLAKIKRREKAKQDAKDAKLAKKQARLEEKKRP